MEISKLVKLYPNYGPWIDRAISDGFSSKEIVSWLTFGLTYYISYWDFISKKLENKNPKRSHVFYKAARDREGLLIRLNEMGLDNYRRFLE